MTASANPWIRATVATALVLGSVVLASCDLAAAGNTAILNAGSTEPPIVEYTFRYSPDDVTGGRIDVVSESQDNLTSTLSANGFTRNDVVSARVDSVTIEPRSMPTFGHLTGADIHLGNGSSGPQIGTGTFSTSQQAARLSVPTRTVTGVIRQGPTSAFASLEPDDPDNVDGVYRVEVVVYYELEVQGV